MREDEHTEESTRKRDAVGPVESNGQMVDVFSMDKNRSRYLSHANALHGVLEQMATCL